jgi:uncharacterized membrane protein
MNVVIIAAIALVILVVLIVIMTGKTKMFVNQTSETESQYDSSNCAVPGTDATCRTADTCKKVGGMVMPGRSCPGDQKCCSR